MLCTLQVVSYGRLLADHADYCFHHYASSIYAGIGQHPLKLGMKTRTLKVERSEVNSAVNPLILKIPVRRDQVFD